VVRQVASTRQGGLVDHSSAPARRPTATPQHVVDTIIALRKRKWSARKIVLELTSGGGVSISVACGIDARHAQGPGAETPARRAPGLAMAEMPYRRFAELFFNGR
jgi:hypothetical protein